MLKVLAVRHQVRRDRLFQGKNKTIWYAKITDNSEDPICISGIVAWFTSFGWDVEVIDLRS